MSSLDSLLGQIEGGKSITTKTTALPARSRDTPDINRRRDQDGQRPPPSASGTSSNTPRPNSLSRTNSSNQIAQKRKAESPLNDSRPKALRNEPVAAASQAGMANASSSAASQPYRGTAGLSRPNLATRTVNSTTKPINGPQSANATSKLTTAQYTTAASSAKPVTANGAAPKKGSYAEIMARASTTQAAPTGIKNKATESIKKAKPGPPGAVVAPTGKGKPVPPSSVKGRPDKSGARPLSAAGAASTRQDIKPQEVKRKPVDLGYKGTARPAAPPAPTYKGTMGLKRPESARRDMDDRRGAGKSSTGNKRYSCYDDEEEEEEEEDDYYSDASSDMEAGVFDVDREEEEALRAAKREDAQEQAKLDELDRDKRRRKQLALAKSLAEKKERMRFM